MAGSGGGNGGTTNYLGIQGVIGCQLKAIWEKKILLWVSPIGGG